NEEVAIPPVGVANACAPFHPGVVRGSGVASREPVERVERKLDVASRGPAKITRLERLRGIALDPDDVLWRRALVGRQQVEKPGRQTKVARFMGLAKACPDVLRCQLALRQ